MEEMSLDSAIPIIRNYIDISEVRLPFFVAFSSRMDIVQLRNRLSSCAVLRLSDFCSTTHSLPDEDRFVESIQHKTSKAIILLGVGEYAALTGNDSLIDRLLEVLPDSAKVVIPLWNGYEKLEAICGSDPRIVNRRCVAISRQNKHWTVKVFKCGLLDTVDANGFKAILHRLEDGYDGTLNAMTAVRLNQKWCRNIDSAYDIYKQKHIESTVPPNFFHEDQWKSFYDEQRERDKRIESADRCLEILEGPANGGYLHQVISRTERFADWKRNLLLTLLHISVGDNAFREMYTERKNLIVGFDEDSIAEYVAETRRFTDPSVQICYLTTSTTIEIAEIFLALRKCDYIPKNLSWIYPELWDYLKTFNFVGAGFADVLTRYFADYKRQKVKNQIEPVFNGVVKELADARPQFSLPSRESVIEKLDGADSCLCWVDALGCEWLGFIKSVSERNGMKLKVTATRAMLPTLTSVNRGFYDGWVGPKLPKVELLDKVKHGDFDNGGINCRTVPMHLSEELKVVKGVLSDIKRWLQNHHGSRVVLTSDHGATRLAVISDSFSVWEMSEKGKHGGRCCKASEFDGDLPSCSTKSDGGEWYVLAGHDRFRGGRIGDVEVHGGATLEEMVVPVIEFWLMDSSAHVELTESKYKVTYRDTEIVLKLFCATKLSNPTLVFGGIRYVVNASSEGIGHYKVRIPKLRAGDYSAEVYDGDTMIAVLNFSVMSGGASVNKNFF